MGQARAQIVERPHHRYSRGGGRSPVWVRVSGWQGSDAPSDVSSHAPCLRPIFFAHFDPVEPSHPILESVPVRLPAAVEASTIRQLSSGVAVDVDAEPAKSV